MEIGFCAINSRFISNNFLFTCFSGAFASISVLIFTEIYRFIQMKKSIEQSVSLQYLALTTPIPTALPQGFPVSPIHQLRSHTSK